MNTCPHISQISLKNLRTFLLRNGWSKVEHPSPSLDVFRNKSDDQLTLPKAETAPDSRLVIDNAIQNLAAIHPLDLASLASNIASLDRDIFTARLIRHSGDEHSLPFRVAEAFISGIKQFLGHAAFTEEVPQEFFEKAGGASAAFTEHCRFGHTFEGSFGFTIESPLSFTEELEMEGLQSPPPPFERRVFQRIASGFGDLHEAIRQKSPDPIVENYERGFNANMCTSLVSIFASINDSEIQENRRIIEYNFEWSPFLASPLVACAPFRFTDGALLVTQSAAERLRHAEEPSERLIEGYISRLRSDKPPGQDEQLQFERTVTVEWEKKDGQWRKVTVHLSPTQYTQACDAHKEGIQIAVRGLLSKGNKSYKLERVTEFRVKESE